MTALAPILARTPVSQIGDVLARMQEIEAALAPTDGIACFNRLYFTVTTNVVAAEQSGVFASVAFLSALDVAFGNLYFDALSKLEAGAAPRAPGPLSLPRAPAPISLLCSLRLRA